LASSTTVGIVVSRRGRRQVLSRMGADGRGSRGLTDRRRSARQQDQQVMVDVSGRLVAPIGVLVESAHHDVLELQRHVGVEPARRNDLGRDVLVRHRYRALPPEGGTPHQHLVEHHSEAVDVRPLVGRVATGLFGTEVGGGTDDRSHLGEAFGGVAGPGHAEVGHLDAAVRRQEDVPGLDVAVDDTAAVGGVERLGDLSCYLGCSTRQELALGLDDVAQGPPPDQLHHHEVGAVLLAPVVDRHYVGMAQVGDRPGLLAEASDEGVRLRIPVVQDLDGHLAVEETIPSLEHIRHAAPRDLRGQLVTTQRVRSNHSGRYR